MPVPHDEALFYNALAARHFGDRAALAKLYARFGNWRGAYEARLLSNSTNRVPGNGSPEALFAALGTAGVQLVMRGDADYPVLFNELADPPFGIYVKGSLAAVTAPDVLRFAIVGTRRATPDGKAIARQFGRELALHGATIVSGLAFGIDAAGHEGCLDAGGTAVAVMAGGLDDVYPHSNEPLARRVLENSGALISEYPFGAPPLARRFLERNRLVSGLSRGVLVVEAPAGSGSLATARMALEQNRDVFVVPGPITHPNFSGSHELIRQGAELAAAPEHILASYNISGAEKIAQAARGATSEEKQILTALAGIGAPADVDKISALTKLEPRIVNRTLSFLLARDLIKEEGGGYTI